MLVDIDIVLGDVLNGMYGIYEWMMEKVES